MNACRKRSFSAGGSWGRKYRRTFTHATLLEKALLVEVVISGIPTTAEVKQFSTDPLGWHLTGKTNLKVGKKSVSIQIGMNLTIVGSKELPKV